MSAIDNAQTYWKGSVLWLTGLSGAGKSTLATALDAALRLDGVQTRILDGDVVRALRPSGFTRVDRAAHVLRVGRMASKLEMAHVTVICALISPYAEDRAAVRQQCHRFLEVYVSTPLEICERRDVKGLYARARRGEIVHFTGIDDPYEPPSTPEIAIDTNCVSLEKATHDIILLWQRIQQTY